MPIPPQRTETFEAFVAPARGRAALWRLLAGFALACLIWLSAILAVLAMLAATGRTVARWSETWLLLGYLASFAGLMLGLWIAARLLHRRGFATLIGPGGLDWRQFAWGAGSVLLAMLVVGGAGALIAPPERQMPLARWLMILPWALPAIFVQTAAEELAFRGYLMQSLAARFRSPLAWWLLPAALFAALHWNPSDFGPDAPLVVLIIGVMGLILGDVTARTGNLSAAIGLHFAHNTVALLILAQPSRLDGLSLYLDGVDPAAAVSVRLGLLLNLGFILVSYGLWRGWWARRQRLHPLRARLN